MANIQHSFERLGETVASLFEHRRNEVRPDSLSWIDASVASTSNTYAMPPKVTMSVPESLIQKPITPAANYLPADPDAIESELQSMIAQEQVEMAKRSQIPDKITGPDAVLDPAIQERQKLAAERQAQERSAEQERQSSRNLQADARQLIEEAFKDIDADDMFPEEVKV